jgi:plastocyanin
MASAATATLQLTDQDGRPLDRAVVTVTSPTIVAGLGTEPVVHLLDQVDKRFVPDVIAIAKGDYIRFPNSDDIRHHVYSFSVPKTFELPLYSGEPENPVHFREAGMVSVGCNIHDRMQASIFIIDGARYTVSVGGAASFAELPDEDLTFSVYHPDAISETALSFVVEAGASLAGLRHAIALKAPPAPDTSAMSELERKFHALRHDTH